MNVADEIRLKHHDERPLYIQLYEQIKSMIKDGRLKPESKLPAIREMARRLNVNAVTIVNAYNRLESEGLVFSRTGSGTYVAAATKTSAFPLFDGDIDMIGFQPMHFNDNVLDFASFTPSPELFPVEHFKALINSVLDRDKGNAFQYQDGRGYQPLRAALVQYLAECGIKSYEDDIQIISGAQQGIDVISKTLLDFGSVVVMESPSYTGAIAAFKSRNARILEVPMESDGMDIDILERYLREYYPRIIYIMTDFHNPTGVSYSIDKRHRILDMASRYDTIIVEDDYLSELNFIGDKLPTLKSLDKDERVIYIKSFSKILMPGLRLGFMVLPRRRHIYNDILNAKHASDISTSGLMQRVFELYLRNNMWHSHLQLIYNEYKKRYECILKALKHNMPVKVQYDIPRGGLHFWLRLPKGYSDYELYNLAVQKNIALMPGSVFYPQPKTSGCFRLSYASVCLADIPRGIEILTEIIDDYLTGKIGRCHVPYMPLF